MSHGSQDPEEIISGINVTPLVDIILVILIIFIVTASFVLRNSIPMDLPKAASGEESVAGLLNVAISAQGELYINGRPAAMEDLAGAVAEARRKNTQGSVSAFVSADIKAQYGAFASIVDRLRLEGVYEIALDTQPVDVSKEQP